MLKPGTAHPSSFRDPSGQVFYHEGNVYRQINKNYGETWQALRSSGLLDSLVTKGMLIPHEEIKENILDEPGWYGTLKPEQLEYISSPAEWCFDMLKDAALLTLNIQEQALNKSFILKDASVYNVQWRSGKPVFIDTLSFETYDERQPWIAYRQFCEQFLGPLILMHYRQLPLQQLYTAYPEGVPLEIISKMLPWKSRLSLHTYLHIHLNAKYSRKHAGVNKPVHFSRKKMKDLLGSLRLLINKCQLKNASSTWSHYYEEAATRDNYLEIKKSILETWLEEIKQDTGSLADVGANEGEFTQLAAQRNISCLAADIDPYCINRLYQKIKRTAQTNILPLVIDLANPTPAVGLNNEERASFLERTKADAVMALALIHHLAVGKNIPLENIAALFNRMSRQWLIIEFVPKTDPKLQFMLSQKKDIYVDYTEENFLSSFSSKFSLLRKQAVDNSGRTLYLFKKK